MKKLLFAAVTLDVGGIETALLTLLNSLVENYEITLVLEKKQGLFLNDLNPKIKVIEYTPSNNKIVIIRKIVNFIKQSIFKLKYKNKFDFSCSYATYSNPDAFVARNASKNSALWCHLDYLSFFNNDKEKLKKFFEEKQYQNFRKIIFVSKRSRENFLKVFPEIKEKTICINNLIDYKKILANSNDKIEEQEIIKPNVTTFINIGRHEEKQKKLSRIIESARLLKQDNDTKDKFQIIFVGDGEDTKNYEELIKKYNLENEIILLGRKKNPYPYLKLADCTILTSDYEGCPVVFVESMVLNKPVITTDVSGVDELKEEHYALITQKDENSIYNTMKNFIEQGFKIQEKFDPEKYNKIILEKLEKLF